MNIESIINTKGKIKIGVPVEIIYHCSEAMDEMDSADSLRDAIIKSSPKNSKYYSEIEGTRELTAQFSSFVKLKVQYFSEN